MKNKKRNVKGMLVLFLPIQILLYYIFSLFPNGVEAFYSNGFFSRLSYFLNSLTSPIPFSLGEVVVYLLFLFLLFSSVQFIRRIIKKKLPIRGGLIKATISILSFTSVLYFFIMIMWGINYFRLPYQNLAKYSEEKPSLEELQSLCKILIGKCNSLRTLTEEDDFGVFKISKGHQNALEQAKDGYVYLSKSLPFLEGSYGLPKKFILPQIWSFFGTGGIYIPFTAEANINMDQPDPMLPSVICHEMAHKVGFAAEDEANFISFLVCRTHPRKDFQYSGYFMALNYSLRTLRAADEKAYEELRSQLSEKVEKDIKAHRSYWLKYSGVLMEFTSDFYSLFLKANQQKEGIDSYSQMVNLLIGEMRKNKAL